MTESKANAWNDEYDNAIFSKFELVGGKYVPPQADFIKHLDTYTNGQEFNLQWKCLGRRAPTPENEEINDHEDDQFTHVETTIDDKDFEFEDELNQLNLSAVRRNATPKGSAKKTKTPNLQSILSNIARHRKIDMLGTEDELKNKMKQEQQKQTELRDEHQMLTEENLSQSSGSQPLHESNLDLQTNQVESSSNSQQHEPSQHSITDKDEMSLEALKHFRMDSPDVNQSSISQPENSSPVENIPNPLHQGQPNSVQVFQNQLPQASQLSFQNILSRTLVSSAAANKSSPLDNLTFSDLQASVKNNSPTANVSESNTIKSTQSELHPNQSSQITTNANSNSVPSPSLQSQDVQMQNSSNLESDVKSADTENDQTNAEMLGSDLPLPEEAKQDLSEFDFHMDE